MLPPDQQLLSGLQGQGSPCTHTSPPCPEAGCTTVAETGASWAPQGGSLPFAQCRPPGPPPSSCSLHLPRAGGGGGGSSGLLPPAACTPSTSPPGLHAPNLSLSCRQNTGCAMGPTGSVGLGPVRGRGPHLLDEGVPGPVRPAPTPSLMRGGGQMAPWPPHTPASCPLLGPVLVP